MNLTATPAKAASCIINRVLFSIRVGKRWFDAWRLKRDPCALEFLARSNFDDHIQSVAYQRGDSERFPVGRPKHSIIRHTKSRIPRIKLVAHLLDLRGLRFEGGGEGLNFILLLGCGRFPFCNGRL